MSYYRARNGNVLGGWIASGEYFNSGESYDGNEGGLTSDDIADVVASSRIPPSGYVRITVTGIPSRDSPRTGDPNYNPQSSLPISRSYVKSIYDIEDVLSEYDGYSAEEVISALMERESQVFYRVDAFEIPDTES